MTEKNIVNVEFNGERVTSTGSLYQYDYGQILNFTDLELPEEFEIDFSFDRCTVSETYIGRNNQVEIPQKYLQISGSVNCYIFLHEGDDDGETEYVVHVPVKARPVRTDPAPTSEQESRIDYLLGRLDQAVASASEYAEQAQQAAESFTGGAVLYNAEQTLTDAEKGRARVNIGAVSASDIPTVFLVKYGQTTASEISKALNAGKYPVICEYDSFTWLWTAAPFVYYFDSQYVFESAHGRDFIRYRLTNGVWSTDRIRDYTVKYESQSLSSSEKAQARANIGTVSSAEVNTLISAYVDSLDASSERY